MVNSKARRICGNINVFSSDTSVADGEKYIYLNDSRTSFVVEKGKVLLKLRYGETLALSGVLHVLFIRFNLIYSIIGKI